MYVRIAVQPLFSSSLVSSFIGSTRPPTLIPRNNATQVFMAKGAKFSVRRLLQASGQNRNQIRMCGQGFGESDFDVRMACRGGVGDLLDVTPWPSVPSGQQEEPRHDDFAGGKLRRIQKLFQQR